MSNFLRSGLAIALASSTLAAGCGSSGEQPPQHLGDVTVRNISPQTLAMSDNPYFYSYEHRRGAVGVGQAAIAHCIIGKEVYVQYGSSEGFISIFTAGTKDSPGGKAQVSPNLETLQDRLPECFLRLELEPK